MRIVNRLEPHVKTDTKTYLTNMLGGALLFLVLAMAMTWFMFKPLTKGGDKTLAVSVTHGDGTVREFVIKTDEEYLRRALEDNKLISGKESDYGLYVLTVDGETADESKQEWWGYTVNGEDALYGVDSQPAVDGDEIAFALHVGW